MKNIILLVLINCFCIAYAYSQTRERYVLDNFEIKDGIRIQTAPLTSPETTNKLLAKKTVPTMLFDKGVWVGENNQATSSKLVEKTAMSSGKSLAGFSTDDDTIDSYIVDSSVRYNIDPLLIYAQMQQESGFKRRAKSHKGASGLMQLMPATAIRFGVTNIYDPRQNINAGVKYMRWLLDKFNGDLNLALAGYNAGEGAVMKYGYQIPPYRETQDYVKKISAHYNSIKKVGIRKPAVKPSQPVANKPEMKQSDSIKLFDRNAEIIRLENGKKGLANL